MDAKLQHFLAVYEHRSLGKAGRALGMSQPALSKSLRQLEQSLGMALFTRHAWGVAPTVYAHTLLPYVRAIDMQFAAAQEELDALKSAHIGVVRVGCGAGASASLLPRTLLRLYGERPGMQVFVEEGLYHPLVMSVREGRLDMAVTMLTNLELPAALAHCRLMADPFHVALAPDHPLRELPGRSCLPRLRDYPWVLPPQNGVLRPHLVALFKQLELPAPTATVQGVSIPCTAELLRKGRFLTLLPDSVLRHYPDLAVLPLPELCLRRDLVAVWNQEIPATPAAEYFLALLRDEAARMSPGTA
ncbi:LysR family transcriptional regulator [Pigmentiphaga sp.]|uniref:LysR family transcriptional regulator n=1 Tax=Pigmentiphaga sp. TaxID=1977564 RepID=UPI0025D435E1|nr:LysR family transcriptional regulator [Pigmentiphaga sp.]